MKIEKFKGLAGIVGVSVLALLPSKLNADGLVNIDYSFGGSTPQVNLVHYNNVSVNDGYDNEDSTYLNPPLGYPGIYSDIYDIFPSNPKLSKDYRLPTSITPYKIETEFSGNVLSPVNHKLNISIPFYSGGYNFPEADYLRFYEHDGAGNIVGEQYNLRDYIGGDSDIFTIDLGEHSVGAYQSRHFTLDFEPITVTPSVHSLKVDFLRKNGVSGATSVIVSYGAEGATFGRDDVVDVGLVWPNSVLNKDDSSFSNVSEGEYGVYSVGAPFGRDRLIEDFREIDNKDSVLIELYHNRTNRNGGWIRLEVLTEDKDFFDDFKLKQRQPGCFNDDDSSFELLLGGFLDGEGKVLVDFNSWYTTFPNENHLYFEVGSYGSFELIHPEGVLHENPEDMAFVIDDGAYAVLTSAGPQEAMEAVGIPEPSTLGLLGGVLVCGLGVYGGRRFFRGRKE